MVNSADLFREPRIVQVPSLATRLLPGALALCAVACGRHDAARFPDFADLV